MITYLTRVTAWLGQHMFYIVLSALLLGFLIPIPDSPALRAIVLGSFGYMTFVTALGTSLKEFLRVLKKPVIPLWILVLIHIISPLIAWLTGILLFTGDHNIQLGYLVAAATPIGVTSVIWTAITGGNVSVALVAVTLDTLIVPVMLPFFFKMVIGQALQIDYMQMMLQLLIMITLPSLAGMIIHDYGRKDMLPDSLKAIGNFFSKVAFFVVIFINSALVGPDITWDLSTLKIVIVTMLLVAAGYFTGYLGSLFFKSRSKEIALAMIYCVGLRNASFGVVLALTFFPHAVAIPVTMTILYQQPFAAIIPYFFRNAAKVSP
ncbi:bile acid:sodium symporter family protein [Sporomusa aerivorans]|uniref:bile acid:sodium symporter family protein n=1 Tax=Sporomusa aerivorans TaxID=204936 RepID=UPI00352A04A8